MKKRKQRGGQAPAPAVAQQQSGLNPWGRWSALPGATAWSANTEAPLPQANGGLYMSAQSTGPWASQPFPATQYALAAEAATVSGLPEVFYHQRPVTNVGNAWTPYVGQSYSEQHWSAKQGPPF